MKVFDNYALYYDLLYKDKDYLKESEYIHSLINKYSESAKSILELGCGTGKHARILAENGYSIHGIDISEKMLEEAEKRKLELSNEIANRLEFSCSDITKVHLDRKFDAVISLFHVISYQTSNLALEKAFVAAREHLNTGGIFIFDCWYGPAVLTEKPSSRIKELENEKIAVIRKAEPVMYPNENMVDVNYTVHIKDKASQQIDEIKETHSMRYLFNPEIEFLMNKTGFELIGTEEWLTGANPDFSTWSVCFIGRAK